MGEKKLKAISIAIVIILALSGVAALILYLTEDKKPTLAIIRVACVGDSLTQMTDYPLDLMLDLGRERYIVGNFGAGSRTVSLSSETPYMNNSQFQSALEFAPNIVVIMLGTNDAQPSLFRYNTSFVGDYLKLVNAFQVLPSKPKIWIASPPPIFSDREGTISPEYFKQTIIPLIEQVADETKLPTIDVFSALENRSDLFPDGVHPNSAGSKIIADTVYKAITLKNPPE